MIRRPPRSTQSRSSAASDVYKRQVVSTQSTWGQFYKLDKMTVVIRTKKFLLNQLLNRKQFIVEVIHPDRPNVPKTELKELLAKKYRCNENQISLFGFHTQFGGGRSQGYCLIYNNTDYFKKYEPKYRLRREKLIENRTGSRKPRKELKRKLKKVRGKELVKMRGTVKK
eukprot:TRINITY_DN132_c0_g1_i5.p1 TRINITY_DN132_c0_g1~~TRINITY_DN132_c0_g1_i5.p1  ORF type:complete len:169 (-),score=83.67 TRINITY_DN132_c0_g1_i5:152-658(-)